MVADTLIPEDVLKEAKEAVSGLITKPNQPQEEKDAIRQLLDGTSEKEASTNEDASDDLARRPPGKPLRLRYKKPQR